MPRKNARERHAALTPPNEWPPATQAQILSAAVAINHPTRRALYESLHSGPLSVGELATRVGIAPGSASHHLEVLAQAGWIGPAPEAARDNRESWWRSLDRSLSWSVEDFARGTRGHAYATSAFEKNVAANMEILRQALKDANTRGQVMSNDMYVEATPAQCRDLQDRLMAVMRQWREEVSQSQTPGRIPQRVVQWSAPIVGRTQREDDDTRSPGGSDA